MTVSPMAGQGIAPHNVALKLQQFQYYLNKNFLRRLQRPVFLMLFCQSDCPASDEGGDCKG